MQQHALPGFGPAREIHNLFFALSPDDATRALIAAAVDELRTRHTTSGRWLKPPRYHMTLQFLGEFTELPPDLVARALAAAQQVRVPAFDLQLDRVGSFGAKQMPVWLGCSESSDPLQQLHAALVRALGEHGCRSSAKRFVPHVTILRDADAAFDQPIAPAIRWRVEAFVLIDSQTQPAAPYRELGRWPLG